MCGIEFDGEVTLGSKNYKYINGDTFTRYYWYNSIVGCWCGYICIPEKVYNQLNEYYAGNTFLGILGDYDDFYCVIGNDDYSFNRLQVKLDYMEEQLLEDYGNKEETIMYIITYKYKDRVSSVPCNERTLHETLEDLIITGCLICDVVKVKD